MNTPRIADAVVPWMHPETTAINRLPMRATASVFPSAAAALAGAPAREVSLDGTWRFKFLDKPEQLAAADLEPGTDDTTWASIQVPGNWTMQGYGRPHYTNVQMPFPHLPPQVPEANPTGVYRTTFVLPEGWQEQRVVLEIGGAESVHAVWLNGRPVGLGKDCRLPSHYDVSPFLQPGRNVLVVQVIQWSDASFIEDQDQWWHGGLHRSVRLIADAARGQPWLADVALNPGFAVASGEGTLRCEVRVGGETRAGSTVHVQIFDATGAACLGDGASFPVHTSAWGNTPDVVGGELRIPGVRPWSAETPVLYRAIVTLRASDGREIAATCVRFGFRDVRIAPAIDGSPRRDLLINGRRVLIKGVNRHDHHDTTGKHVDRATMLADIRVMKAHHINAVRCSHYPNAPEWLDLCDEYGLYVIDEANLESHAFFRTICHDPRYAMAFLERAQRMVLRDRNHPCIIMWSLGNESGYGPNHDAMAGWIRRVDPSRPLHYEGAICRWHGEEWNGGHAVTDVIAPMYPTIADIVAWARSGRDPRPIILCEFSHAMGNSNGSLADYWDAIRTTPGLQGGFIWEWVEHGLRQVDAQGRAYWAYGGDFGDAPNDANFVCDGLVWPDRTPHPAMREVAACFRPIEVEVASLPGRVFTLRNGWDFTDTASLRGTFSVTVDGVEVERGAWTVPTIAPGATAFVGVPFQQPLLRPGQEAHLTVSLFDSRDLPLIGRDGEVGHLQCALPVSAPAQAWPARTRRAAAPVRIDGPQVLGDGLRVVVDTASGQLSSWIVDGRERILTGPALCVWRAPTDNDGIRLMDRPIPGQPGRKPLMRWMLAGLDRASIHVDAVELRQAGAEALIVVRRRLVTAPMAGHTGPTAQPSTIAEVVTTRVCGNGSLLVAHEFTVDAALHDLPRLGTHLTLPEGYESLEFFGHGPEECYSDRHRGSDVVRVAGTVSQRYVNYTLPQEHGNIFGLRWLALRDGDGHGVLVSAEGRIEGNASRYGVAQLQAARHTIDLSPEPRIHLHLDVAQRGLGTASCGPDTLERYWVRAGTHHLHYGLLPLRPGDDAGLLHRQRSF